MNTPASPASGSVSLSLSSQPTDAAGIKNVVYQYRASGQTGAFSTACTATAAPWSCNWVTSAGSPADGTYSLQAVATDNNNQSTTASNAPVSVTVANGSTSLSAFTITNPGSPIHASVALSLSSAAPSDTAGLKSIAYQYRLSGTTGAFKTACTATAAPWSCAFSTTSTADGAYDLQALATDNAAKTAVASNAPLHITIDNTRPTAKSIQTQNASGTTKGKINAGDSVTFTYSEQIAPASVMAGWNGTATAVQAQFDTRTATNLTIWTPDGKTKINLATPVALGGAYISTTTAFAATMTMTGTSITVTLGALQSGTVASAAVTGGTVTWTPNTNATDLAGKKVTPTAVSTPGPAF